MFLIRISALYLCHCSAVWLVVYCWSSFFTRGLVLDYWDMVCRPRRRRHEENRGNEGRALRGFPEHRIELLPSTGSIHFRCRRRHSLYGIHELGSPVLHRIHPLGADLRSIFDRSVFLNEKIHPMGFCLGKKSHLVYFPRFFSCFYFGDCIAHIIAGAICANTSAIKLGQVQREVLLTPLKSHVTAEHSYGTCARVSYPFTLAKLLYLNPLTEN